MANSSPHLGGIRSSRAIEDLVRKARALPPGAQLAITPVQEQALVKELEALEGVARQKAVEQLLLFKDSFEFSDNKRLEQILPKVEPGAPPPAKMRARPLGAVRAPSEKTHVTRPKEVQKALGSVKETASLAEKHAPEGTAASCPAVDDVFAEYVNSMRKDGNLKFSEDALKPLKHALAKAQENGFQPAPELDRRYQTEGRTFEDRIMNFMFKFAFKHLGEMSKLTAESDEGEATKAMERAALKLMPMLKQFQAMGGDQGYLAKQFKERISPEQLAKMGPEVQE